MIPEPVGNLAWLDAVMRAEEGDFSGIAYLLRNEAFTIDMKARRRLAALLPGQRKGGAKAKTIRDYDLYLDVRGYKAKTGRKNISNAELKTIAKPYGLYETGTINTAIKNGRRIANEIDAINRLESEE